MVHEQYQQFVLQGSQLYRASGALHLSCRLVDFQVGIGEEFPTHIVTAQHCADASHQLIEGERLRHIVISPEIQGVHLVLDIIASSEHDDGHVIMEAQAAAQLEAILPWHRDIEEHNVGLILLCRCQASITIHGCIDLKALVSQAAPQQCNNLRIVVH